MAEAKKPAAKELGLHNYRVTAVLVGLNDYTIIANSPAEAMQKVDSGEGGRPGGSQGPVPLLMQVHDRSILDPQGPPTLERWVGTIKLALENLQRQQGAEQPQVVVPRVIEAK